MLAFKTQSTEYYLPPPDIENTRRYYHVIIGITHEVLHQCPKNFNAASLKKCNNFKLKRLCMSCMPKSNLPFLVRALWFVLEIIMAKNENNSHAFIRKMVENIKQTKDAQAPTDPKTNEVHISVCKTSSHTLNV